MPVPETLVYEYIYAGILGTTGIISLDSKVAMTVVHIRVFVRQTGRCDTTQLDQHKRIASISQDSGLCTQPLRYPL